MHACFKLNLMFWTTVTVQYTVLTCHVMNDMVRVIEGKISYYIKVSGIPSGTKLISLRVAVPTPPEEKREGGNVYEELTRIVLFDVTVIYVTYM